MRNLLILLSLLSLTFFIFFFSGIRTKLKRKLDELEAMINVSEKQIEQFQKEINTTRDMKIAYLEKIHSIASVEIIIKDSTGKVIDIFSMVKNE